MLALLSPSLIKLGGMFEETLDGCLCDLEGLRPKAIAEL
jgi:hypothetical protein